jgi:hypothetical protein
MHLVWFDQHGKQDVFMKHKMPLYEANFKGGHHRKTPTTRSRDKN